MGSWTKSAFHLNGRVKQFAVATRATNIGDNCMGSQNEVQRQIGSEIRGKLNGSEKAKKRVVARKMKAKEGPNRNICGLSQIKKAAIEPQNNRGLVTLI